MQQGLSHHPPFSRNLLPQQQGLSHHPPFGEELLPQQQVLKGDGRTPSIA